MDGRSRALFSDKYVLVNGSKGFGQRMSSRFSEFLVWRRGHRKSCCITICVCAQSLHISLILLGMIVPPHKTLGYEQINSTFFEQVYTAILTVEVSVGKWC